MQLVNSFSGVQQPHSPALHPTLKLIKQQLDQGIMPFPQANKESLSLEGQQAPKTGKRKFKFFKTLALGTAAALTLKLLYNKFKTHQAQSVSESADAAQKDSGPALDITA